VLGGAVHGAGDLGRLRRREAERLRERRALAEREVRHVVEGERLALEDPAQHLLDAERRLPPPAEVRAERGVRFFGEEADQVDRGGCFGLSWLFLNGSASASAKQLRFGLGTRH
jgi:hypothetical protein